MIYESFADAGIFPNRSNGNVKMACPKCGHSGLRSHPNDKSLSVDLDKGVWNCHYCHFRGGVRRKDHDWTRRPTPVYARPEPTPEDAAISRAALIWFEQRKISRASLDKFKVYTEGRTIRFPYTRDGELVNIKTRFPNKKFAMEEGCELIFWGLDQCDAEPEQMVIVEGEPDLLALDTCGIPNVLSVPNGANTGKMTYMDSAAHRFETARVVLVAVDADEKGQELQAELVRRIGKEKCFTVSWPEGCKDANDVLVAHGPERVRQCLADATPCPIDGAHWMTEYHDAALALLLNPRMGGESTGWRSLDEHYTVIPGELTVVTGVPGSGKSEFLDALMVNLAQFAGWTFAVHSPENEPAEHYLKLASKYLALPYTPGPHPSITPADLAEFNRWLREKLVYFDVERPTIETLIGLARTFVFRDGIRGLVIDPWNRLDQTRDQAQTLTEHVRDTLGALSSFAKKAEVHVWLMAHPKKLITIGGETPVPTPYDISDSAHFYNMADNCLTVARDKNDDAKPVQIHIQKVRRRRVGRIGTIGLAYDPLTGRYRDL